MSFQIQLHNCHYKFLAGILFFHLTTTAVYAQMEMVHIDNGSLSGITEGSTSVFKGIPYAAPPVGSLRWRAPQPAENWEGTYPANKFAPACMQIPPPEGSFSQVEFYPEPEPTSEDCLYLNVWTEAPSADDRRPVMVWIHGGGFSQGSGSMPTFNGKAFAKKGVVLVTINYRLGIFGLFAHPELTEETNYKASGNYGLLDQVAALKWIQNNISAFGGDPGNVTIFGQSSGAGNVNKLLASPRTKGLFHRAILQSGSAYTFGKTTPLEQVEHQGQQFADEHQIQFIEELRSWPADTLLQRGRDYSFSLNVDGWLLPEETWTVFENGQQHPVPILTGSTADEGNAFFGPQLDKEIFLDMATRSYGDDADAFLSLYAHQTDKEARESYNKWWSHRLAWGAHTLAKIHSQTSGSDTYLYYFNQNPPGRNSDRYGAFHSAEIAYVFQTLDAVDRPWTKSDRILADKIATYWVNFASTGNPNDKNMPHWHVYDPTAREAFKLGGKMGAVVPLNKDILNFYDNLMETTQSN